MLHSHIIYTIIGLLVSSQMQDLVCAHTDENSSKLDTDRAHRIRELLKLKEYLSTLNNENPNDIDGSLESASPIEYLKYLSLAGDGQENDSELENNEEKYETANSNYINNNSDESNTNLNTNNQNDATDENKRSAFLRFGKRNPAYLRFGRGQAYLRFGKRTPNSYLRFGKRNPAYLRFGRSVKQQPQEQLNSDKAVKSSK